MKLVAASVAIAGAMAAPSAPPAGYAPAPVYEALPLNYAFGYGVHSAEPATKLDQIPTVFGHDENAEPAIVTGCYEVYLPDGRYQTVKYTADPAGDGGFHPIISYSSTGGGCGAPVVYKPQPPPPPPTTTTTTTTTPAPVIRYKVQKQVCDDSGCHTVDETDVHEDHHDTVQSVINGSS